MKNTKTTKKKLIVAKCKELLQQQEVNRQNQTQENLIPYQKTIIQPSRKTGKAKIQTNSILNKKLKVYKSRLMTCKANSQKQSMSKKLTLTIISLEIRLCFLVGSLVGAVVIGFFVWFLRKRN